MLTLQQAREYAREVLDEQGPGFKYDSKGNGDCFYVPVRELMQWAREGRIEKDAATALLEDTTSPSYNPSQDPRYNTGCYVGRILDKFGEKRQRAPELVACTVSDLVEAFPDMMTAEAATYLGNLQYHQDDGKTWGDAHRIAEAQIIINAFS